MRLDKPFASAVLCAQYFMRALIFSLLAFGMLLMPGCKSGKVCDLRIEGGEVCPIHHLYMHSEKFPNPHLTTPPSREYLQARMQYFIHAKPTLYMLPDDCKTAMVYVCDDCIAAEKQWRAAHPGEAP